MSGENRSHPRVLPYPSTLPSDPQRRRRAVILRVAACVALAALLVGAVVQFQVGTMSRLRKATAFDREHPDWSPAAATQPRPGATKGAIGRWRSAIHQFWDGGDIYKLVPADRRFLKHPPVSSVESPADYGMVYLHPNSPFVVLLLTPLAYMPVWAMALSYNLLKLLAIVAAVAMAARLAGVPKRHGSRFGAPAHGAQRAADWAVLLGVAWTIMPVIGDIQHGNTNIFAMAAIVLHLWVYRRGGDLLAGLPLAAAVWIKMTPALFLLYWLYQRNWKLLAGAALGLALFGAALPAAAMGPSRYAELTSAWYRNVIRPGLVKGSWYPEHINQSLSGVLSRYFLAGQDGDIYWGPDDDPHYETKVHGWITLVALPEPVVRGLLRAGQLAILAVLAWAIGWGKLPRNDGRRALHYALVLLAMMLLNQRTWDHHAAVLLPAGVAIWQAVTLGRMSRSARTWALGLTLAAGSCILLARTGLFAGLAWLMGRRGDAAEQFGNLAEAVGPTFYYFVLLLAAAAVLSAALRRAEEPYAAEPQEIRADGA